MTSPGPINEPLGALFPFHLAVDRQLLVVRAGRSLLKLSPEAVGRSLPDLVELPAPAGPLDFESLSGSAGTALVWELREPRIAFRGQVVAIPDEGVVALVGSPRLGPGVDLTSLGLAVADFAPHDATPDLLREVETCSAARARAEGIAAALPDAFVSIDEASAIREFSPAAEALFGWKAEELLGRHVGVLMPEPDRSAHDGYVSRSLRTGERRVIGRRREVVALRRDGTLFPCEVSIGEVRTSRGVVFSGFLRDLSAQKAAESALRESERSARALVEGVKDVVFRTDAEGRWLFVNSAWEEVTGWAVAETLGRPFLEFVHPDDRARSAALFRSFVAGQVDFSRHETRFVARDGSVLWIEVSARRPDSAADGSRGATGTLRDVTERHAATDELVGAKEAAVAAEGMKSAFLANMSHEIRTPLNAVIGMTGLLLETALSREQQEYVDTIRRSGKTLLELINDILDFSRIESGKLRIVRSPFLLRECAEDAIDFVAPLAAEKELELVLDVEVEAGSTYQGDEGRIRQVVMNLLSNAVKFTAKGEVVLSVSAAEAAGGGRVLRFAVRDTGPGIPEKSRQRLFEAFLQVDSAATRRYGGSGLGLAISRQLAVAMGGSVTVESAVGAGSTFTFEVPIERVPPPSGILRRVEALPPGSRVLLIEDNAAARAATRRLIRQLGAQVVAVSSGEEALGRVAAGEEYALVLADATLPGVPASAVLRAFRSRFGPRAPAAVVAVRLGARLPAGESFGSAVATVSKPIKAAPLAEAVLLALRLTRPDAALVPVAKSGETRLGDILPLRILLVEDNAVNQRVATLLLEKLGYWPHIASNGIEALEAVRGQRFDVVLMDVQMPEMDGLEATRAIRSELPRESQPRIVALTAGAFQAELDRCLEAGMDDYLTKPVRRPELVAALEKCRRARRPRGVPQAPGRQGRVSEALEELARMSGDSAAGFLAETVEIFRRETKDGLAAIEEQIRSNDPRQAVILAHGLKGSARTMGAEALAEAMLRLEEDAREGFSDKAPRLLARARREFELLDAFLSSQGWDPGPGQGRTG